MIFCAAKKKHAHPRVAALPFRVGQLVKAPPSCSASVGRDHALTPNAIAAPSPQPRHGVAEKAPVLG